MPESVRMTDVVRVGRGGSGAQGDLVAVEEPLEIRLHGSTFIVTMRTPGADRELAAGLLLSERIVGGAKDIGAITPGPKDPAYETASDPAYETASGPGHEANVVNVTLAGDAANRAAHAIAGRRLVDRGLDADRGVARTAA